jgi:hypothetical protein
MKTYLIIALSLISCAFAPQTSAALSGTVLITDARISVIKSRIASQVQPTYKAWTVMKSYVDAHLNDACLAPSYFNIPPLYSNPKGHDAAVNSIEHDSALAYKLALAYRLTGNEVYAASCVRFLNGWTKVTFSTSDSTKLVWNNRFPSMIVAADLIKHSAKFTAAQQLAFKNFVRLRSLPMNNMSWDNNHGNWGLLLVVSTAAYLQDQTLFNQAVARWKFFIEDQINNAGEMKYEIHRCGGSSSGGCDGIIYSNFALIPQTEAAEIMKVNGVNIFGYVSPSGHTLKKAYDKMAYWSRYPCTFPYYSCPTRGLSHVKYMEILNPIWPNANAVWLLAKYRPLDLSQFSFPVMTLTHGNLKL